MAEQRDFTGVQLNFAAKIRAAQRGDMLTRHFHHFWIVDQDFTNILTQIVAKRAYDDVAFLMDQERRGTAFSGFLNGLPVFQAEA